MLKHIVLSGSSALHLMNVLARGSRDDTGDAFSGVILLWLDCISMQIQKHDESRGTHFDMMTFTGLTRSSELPPIRADKSLFDREKEHLVLQIVDNDGPLLKIIKFTTMAAEQNTFIRLGMLDAGSLALVLTAFANADFRLPNLLNVLRKDGKGKKGKLGRREVLDEPTPLRLSTTAINAEASALSVLIHTAKFVKPWRGERLDTRLSLSSSLVDSLLGKDRVLDNEYEVTRALFREIVNATT
jgi:hypothetical protein